MLRSSLLFFILLSCTVLSAQSVVTDTAHVVKKRVVFGMNVTGILARVLGNTPSFGNDPYLLTLRIGPDKSHWRMGLNFKFQSSSTPADSVFASSEINRKSTLINYRCGWETIIPVSKKVDFYWGIDGLLNLDFSSQKFQSTFNNVFSTLKTSNWGLGVGPVFGVQWHIAPRLLLSTETSLYAVYNVQKNSTVLSNDTSESTVKSFGWQPNMPTSIHLNFVFR